MADQSTEKTIILQDGKNVPLSYDFLYQAAHALYISIISAEDSSDLTHQQSQAEQRVKLLLKSKLGPYVWNVSELKGLLAQKKTSSSGDSSFFDEDALCVSPPLTNNRKRKKIPAYHPDVETWLDECLNEQIGLCKAHSASNDRRSAQKQMALGLLVGLGLLTAAGLSIGLRSDWRDALSNAFTKDISKTDLNVWHTLLMGVGTIALGALVYYVKQKSTVEANKVPTHRK